MPNSKSKLDWCLASEKRMKNILPNDKLSKEHIEKAKHNLKAADYNIKGHFDDWAVSQSYYAMYHALLAILFKKGFESKNHECTINTVEFLIEAKEINLNMEDLSFIRTTEKMTAKDAKSLREEFQYGTQTDVNKVLLAELLEKSKAIVEKIEVVLSEAK
ncbi:HEPN domain-containing protein [Candidatus Pacearchaeota archaeon]|nr:HEPN domain-containing protein [Candidatus Pacearchaeota archaeon]